MSDLKVKLVLEALDRLTQPVRQMAARIRQFASQMNSAFRSVGQSMRNVGRSMNEIGKNMTMKLTTAIGGVGFASLKTAGDIEALQIKFGSLLQSTSKANDMVQELINFTANSPFQLQGVSKAAVQLLTADVAAENVTNRLSVLADIAALAGTGMDELGLIYSRVRSQQVAYTMELDMLNDRGVPIWQELARITGKSVLQIRKEAANGIVTFELFEQALENMRNEGGVAYEQAVKQSKGWNGLLSTLRDNINLAFAEIGNSMVVTLELKKFVSDLVKSVQEFTAWFQKLPQPMQSFIIKGGLILALLGPLIMMIGQLSMGIGVLLIGTAKLGTGIAVLSGFMSKTLIPAIWATTTATVKMGAAFMATPIGWITAAIAALAVAGFLIIKNWDKIRKFWANLWGGIVQRVRTAAEYIMPVIEAISKGMDFITDNAVTRGIGRAADFVTGNDSDETSPVQGTKGQVDTGGELRIVIDENRRASVQATMNDKNTNTVVDQGVLMGSAL